MLISRLCGRLAGSVQELQKFPKGFYSTSHCLPHPLTLQGYLNLCMGGKPKFQGGVLLGGPGLQFELKFPFRSAAQVAAGVASGNSRQVAGGQYHLTYLDEDMLIGRAIALGGTFVFTRAPEPENE
eukprot:890954-Pelagomonas_calceolata.AAC.1